MRFSSGHFGSHRKPAPAGQRWSGGTVAPQSAAPVSAASAPLSEANLVQKAGVIFLGLYLFSYMALLNETMLVTLGIKPYITKVCGPLVLACALIGGGILRGLRSRIGVLWLLFVLWNILAIPFSTWPGGSFQGVVGALPSYALVFLIPSLAISLRQVRILVYFMAAGTFVVLASCIGLGTMQEGRLSILHTTLGNPNDLALHLFVGMAFLLVFLRVRSPIAAFGVLAIAAVLLCILRTGSRGTFLSLLGVTTVFFFIGGRGTKLMILATGLLLAITAAFIAPKATLQRLTLIVTDAQQAAAEAKAEPESGSGSGDVERSIASQASRQELLKKSIEFTLQHPIFGVGPTEFPDVLQQDAKAEGRHAQYLRPHNAYTQISAEAGIPALAFYLAVMLLAIRANYRFYKAVRGVPGLEAVFAQSVSLLALSLVYALNSVFVHVSAFSYQSLAVGLSLATHLAAQGELPLLNAKSAPANFTAAQHLRAPVLEPRARFNKHRGDSRKSG